MADQLDRPAARARCEAATEGPWKHRIQVLGNPGAMSERESDYYCGRGPYHQTDTMGDKLMRTKADADALFIAHARTDLPAALDALDEAEAEATRWQEMFAGLKEKYPEIFAEFWKEDTPCQE